VAIVVIVVMTEVVEVGLEMISGVIGIAAVGSNSCNDWVFALAIVVMIVGLVVVVVIVVVGGGR
jgi:hypothetical protein